MHRLGLIAAFSAIVPGVCMAQTDDAVSEAAIRATEYCVASSSSRLTDALEPVMGPAGFTVSHHDGRERWTYGDAVFVGEWVESFCVVAVRDVPGIDGALSDWMAEQEGFQAIEADVLHRLVNPEAASSPIDTDAKHHFRAQDGGVVLVSWNTPLKDLDIVQPGRRFMIAVRAMEGSTDGR